MESLLANYGSDDEEDEVQPSPAKAPLFSPPRFADGTPSSEIPARRSSLFASLPPPKLGSEDDFRVSENRSRNLSEERKAAETPSMAARRDAGDAFIHRETRSSDDSESRFANMATRASDGANGAPKEAAALFSQGSKRVSLFGALPPPKSTDMAIKASDIANGASKEDAAIFSQGNKRVSLFGALPPPKSTGSSMGILNSQPLLGAASKRVVEIRPVINMALLQDLDDDDDIHSRAKRHATEVTASGKLTGLAAILPKPRNSGSTLGSGHAAGHHATLDVGAPMNPVPSGSESRSSDSAPQSMHEASSFSHEHASETWNNYEHHSESHVSASSGAWDDYSHDVSNHANAVQLNSPSSALYHSSIASQEGSEVFHSEDYYSMPDDYSQGMVANDTSSPTMPSAQNALANMLMKERRKGGKSAPLNIIEVKQADLTATKLREDQLRTTGIAFGPAYKPISSNKGKPSKLHRRKHQIGSLYYDMKQKEMELLERRSKGNMTKAETQAKYGW